VVQETRNAQNTTETRKIFKIPGNLAMV